MCKYSTNPYSDNLKLLKFTPKIQDFYSQHYDKKTTTKKQKKQLTDKIYIIQSYVKPCKVNAIQRN